MPMDASDKNKPNYPFNPMQDTIWTNASLTPDLKPCVIWQYKSCSGVFTLPEARSKAMGLLHAAAIAQVEAAITDILYKTLNRPRGFKQYDKKPDVTAGIIALIRGARQPLIDGVKAIYGQKTKLPLLNIYWYGEAIQMEMATVSFHAEVLLRTAEVAESDAFLRFFLSKQCNVPLDETQIMIEDFAQYRNQQSLEQLFENSI